MPRVARVPGSTSCPCTAATHRVSSRNRPRYDAGMGRWLWAPLLLASSIGRAEPLRLEKMQDGCALDALEGSIDALAGRDAFESGSRPRHPRRGRRIDGTPAARVWMSDATGQLRGPRVVTAKTCDELVQAVSVVVAMVLPPPDPPHRDPPPPPVIEVDEPAPAPPIRTELRVFAAGAATASGSHEQVLAGMEWRHGWASLQLAVDHDQAATIDVGPLAAIEMSRSDLQVAACAHDGAFAVCPVLGCGRDRRQCDRPVARALDRVAGAVHGSRRDVGARAVAADRTARACPGRRAADDDGPQVDHMSVWRSPRFDGAAGLGIVVQFP